GAARMGARRWRRDGPRTGELSCRRASALDFRPRASGGEPGRIRPRRLGGALLHLDAHDAAWRASCLGTAAALSCRAWNAAVRPLARHRPRTWGHPHARHRRHGLPGRRPRPRRRNPSATGSAAMTIRLRHLVHVLAALVVTCAAVFWSGIISISASSGHWTITDLILHTAMRRSVIFHARNITVPPDLEHPGLVRRGAAHFESGCAPCHGSP